MWLLKSITIIGKIICYSCSLHANITSVVISHRQDAIFTCLEEVFQGLYSNKTIVIIHHGILRIHYWKCYVGHCNRQKNISTESIRYYLRSFLPLPLEKRKGFIKLMHPSSLRLLSVEFVHEERAEHCHTFSGYMFFCLYINGKQ